MERQNYYILIRPKTLKVVSMSPEELQQLARMKEQGGMVELNGTLVDARTEIRQIMTAEGYREYMGYVKEQYQCYYGYWHDKVEACGHEGTPDLSDNQALKSPETEVTKKPPIELRNAMNKVPEDQGVNMLRTAWDLLQAHKRGEDISDPTLYLVYGENELPKDIINS